MDLKEKPTPLFLDENSTEFKQISNSPQTTLIDYYANMAAELSEIRKISQNNTPIKPGRWVYYPWSYHLIKILDKEDFQDLTTARNRNVITLEEQEKFRNAVIGIAGLSIGNSAALAIIYNGGSETIKLADPDYLDGSNLNRIRAGLKNLGESKAYIAAKQIYEINPYVNLILYPEGLTSDNLQDFILGKPELDIIVDEMDNLLMKIFIRLAARATRKPLIMATDNADNVIIDVDRFDKNPNLPPFDTLPEMDLETISKNINTGEKLELTSTERVLLATSIVGAENIAPRMQNSLLEVGKTLVSWPQPATSAFSSGPALAYVARKIILGEELNGGKSHLSLDRSLLSGYDSEEAVNVRRANTDKFISTLNQAAQKEVGENYFVWETKEEDFPKNASQEDQLKFLLNYAVMAPSAHNTQPWKFKINEGEILLYLDKDKTLPVSDPTHRESFLSLGTALENLQIAANHFGFSTTISPFPNPNDEHLVARIKLTPGISDTALNKLFPALKNRLSNRNLYEDKTVPTTFLEELATLKEEGISLHLVSEKEKINQISDLIFDGSTEMMKSTTFREELSGWLRHNFTRQPDGMPGFTLGLNPIQSLLGSFLIKNFDMGASQAKIDQELVKSSSLLIVITSQENGKETWLKIGKLYEKVVLMGTLNGLSNATLASVVELGQLPEKLKQVLLTSETPQVFLRMGFSKDKSRHSPRKKVEDVLVS